MHVVYFISALEFFFFSNDRIQNIIYGTLSRAIHLVLLPFLLLVEKVTVETGIGLGGFVEVIGEVEKGDRIVTRGGERLQPGQVVTIADS